MTDNQRKHEPIFKPETRSLAIRSQLNPHIRTLRLYVVRMIRNWTIDNIQPPIGCRVRAESPLIGLPVHREERVADVGAIGRVGVRLEVGDIQCMRWSEKPEEG
jgi:hypothetical protein